MKKSENNYVTSMEFTNALNKYIPSLVLQQWMSKIENQSTQVSLPELQSTETVVLFADISGFTMISEACALMGVRGNEELAFCINRYMEGMVKSLGKYGGDIIKFVGDAMIVMWPRVSADPSQSPSKSVAFKDQVDDRVTVVRKAIQCALDIQNELNNKKIMSNVTNLSVKIGIGYGECALLYVGGVFNRSEFFTVGNALTQALKSEENATAGGQIIVSQNAWRIASEYFKSEEIDSEHGGKFYRITGMGQGGIRTRADAVLLRNMINADDAGLIQNKLKSCIPAAIMPYLEIGYEKFGSETRRLTVMFASLGVDLSSAQTQAGMMKIQKIVTTVQQQVYRMEGSLNKLVMDDKGSTLICIWGLCPFAHEDDAARAILTAMNMKRELMKIENTWCNVGISTGEVFSGVVGTSGSRKEFSVLGDYVNLAARIMYYPKKYKQVNKINVDLQTKKEAENFISFQYKSHCEFKGKSISLPIFEPIDPQEEMIQCLNKIVSFDVFLKIHNNPFLVDKDSDYKKKYCRQVGRENLLHKVCDDLYDFFDHDNNGNQRPYLLSIYGETGSGKTLFARCLYDQLKRKKDFLRDDSLGSDMKAILTSSLNPESQMRFLNSWRPILQMMLFIISKRNKLKPDQAIKELTAQIQDDQFDILMDIFNFPDLKKKKISKELIDPLHFVKREKYSDDIVDGILDFLIEFIKEVLGEKDEYTSDQDQSQMNSIDGSKYSHQNIVLGYSENPMVLIFDTVFLMDEPSWKLIELVKDECRQIALILLVQTDTNNQAKIHFEAKNFFQETFANHMDTFKIIDLPPLKIEEFTMLITDISPKYRQSMTDEIKAMTYIEDPVTSIKNPENCKLKEIELMKKYQVNETFQIVQDEVLQTVIQRCEGNILVSLSFLFNLIINNFVIIKDSILQPSPTYTKCKVRNDWASVPVPGITQKINSSLIDSFLKEMRSKSNKTDSENGVKGILLLKYASVIGEVFSSKVLQNLNPIRNESYKSIVQILKILEQRDFIEILDETDHKNIICRFRKCFLRETIYQFMLYRAQKKGLHQLMVQYIQNNPNQFDNDQDEEVEKLVNHILAAEDFESEDKVPYKQKQGLVIKKIANKITKHPNAILKSGWLTKQGDKPNKKVEKRLMILKSKQISWFHNEKELQNNKPLGVIPLTSIYHCVPANTAKSTQDLNIGSCAWSKKDIEKEGKREFIFGAKDEQERDEWISSIEYLRAKAIYDSFVQKYCNITFPLRGNSEEVLVDQREDYLSLLNDFGMKIKTQIRVNKVQAIQQEEKPSFNQRMTSKVGSFASYNIRETADQQVSSINNPKDIAQKLKKLYTCQIVSFVNQIAQNSNKQSSNRFETLKRVPDVIKYSSIPMKKEELLFEKNGGIKSPVIKPSIFLNQSQNLQDESSIELSGQNLKDEKVKVKQFRKMSLIAKKDAFDDGLEVKTYLDDLKSNKVSPTTKNNPEVKITEENEDENSDGSVNTGSIPRKSGISTNTFKSTATPNQGGNYYTSNNSEANLIQNNSQRLESLNPNSQRDSSARGQSPPERQTDADQNLNQKFKSRISTQLELIQGLKKQREYTFHKQEDQNTNTNVETINPGNGEADQNKMFSLNVKHTKTGESPKKKNKAFNSAKEEEKIAVQAKSNKQVFQQNIIEENSSSSSESAKKKESEEETDNIRDTGNFSRLGSDFQQTQQNQSQSKQQTQKNSNNQMNQNVRSAKSVLIKNDSLVVTNKVNPTLQHLAQISNSKEPANMKVQTPDSSHILMQQQVIQPNLTEIISQTIKDQVSKSLSQMFSQVQKISGYQQQQVPIQSSPSETTHQNPNIKSESSLTKSVASSLYDDDWRQHVEIRQKTKGGAASSKKVSLVQAQSKDAVVQLRQGKDKRREREETEVEEDDEESRMIESDFPLAKANSQIRSKSRNDLKTNQGSYQREIINKSLTNGKAGRPNQDFGNPNQHQSYDRVSSIPKSNSPYYRTYDYNSYMPQSQGLPIHNLPSQVEFSPINQPIFMTPPFQNQQYMSAQQQMLYQQNLPNQFQMYDQPTYQQPQLNPYLQQYPPQRYPTDSDFFQAEDQLDHTITHPQHYIGDLSSIIADASEPQYQYAIVLEDTQCQLKGEMMQLFEGDKVEVLRILNDLNMIECKFNNQIGIFPVNSLKLIKRNPTFQSSRSNAQMSSQQRNMIDSENSIHLQRLQMQRQQNIMNSQNNMMQEMVQDRNQQRQNFFKMQGNEIQDQSYQSLGNQSKAQNLKLNERKRQRMMQNIQEDDPSADQIINQLNL